MTRVRGDSHASPQVLRAFEGMAQTIGFHARTPDVSQLSTIALSGGSRYTHRPITSTSLSTKRGSRESLKVPCR